MTNQTYDLALWTFELVMFLAIVWVLWRETRAERSSHDLLIPPRRRK